MPLKKFATHDIVIDKHEAWQILVYFFGGNAGINPGQLTYNDVSFAQALLVEAVGWSYNLKVNSSANTIVLNKPRVGKARDLIIRITINLMTRTAKNWWSSPKQDILARPELWPGVEQSLWRDWHDAWDDRIKTGAPVY